MLLINFFLPIAIFHWLGRGVLFIIGVTRYILYIGNSNRYSFDRCHEIGESVYTK